MDAQRHQALTTAHGSTVDPYNRGQSGSKYAQDGRRSSYTGLSKPSLSKPSLSHSSHAGSHSGSALPRGIPGYGHQPVYSAHAVPVVPAQMSHPSGHTAHPSHLQPLHTNTALRGTSHGHAVPSHRHPSGHTAHPSSDRLYPAKAPSQRRRSSSASRVPSRTTTADHTATARVALQGSLSQQRMVLAGGAAPPPSVLKSYPYDRLSHALSRQSAQPLTSKHRSHTDPHARMAHDASDLTSMSTTSRSKTQTRASPRPQSLQAFSGRLNADSSASSLRSCSTAMHDTGTAASMMSMLSIGSAASTSPHAQPRPLSASRHDRQRADALMDTSSSSASCATPQHADRPPPAEALCRGGGVAGLRNLGNTCFMNSVLQCLAAVPDVLHFVLNGAAEPVLRDATVAPVYKRLLVECITSPAGHTVTPRALRDAMARLDRRWGAGAQQDSHEFLLALLERLQAECDRTPAKPKYRELTGKGSVDQQAAAAASYAREWSDSWVDDCFGGLLQSTVQCRQCGDESHCFDACMDLGLPVPRAAGGEAVPLRRCLEAFTEREELDAVYRCERCGADTRRTKALRVYTPPRTLILHLKRFSHRSSAGGNVAFGRRPQFAAMRKDAAEVDVPARLDLEPFCNPAGLRACHVRPRYRLIGVSEHAGGMGGGHYTATVRNPWKPWYHCNDASVHQAVRPEGPSSTAYVLIYRLT